MWSPCRVHWAQSVLSFQGPASCSGSRMLSAQLPPQGEPCPGGLESSRWGALLSCLCLIPSLPSPPALPDSFSKNKSPASSSSMALSQLSPQGGEVEVKFPLELPGAAVWGCGVDFRKALRPLLSPCPVAGLGLACDAEFNTFSFSAGFPFYQIKSALFLLILNIYFFKQLIFSGGVQDLLVLACGTLLPDQESHLGPVHWEHRVLVDHQGSLCLFLYFCFCLCWAFITVQVFLWF